MTLFSKILPIREDNVVLCLKKAHTFWTCINFLEVHHSFFSSSSFYCYIFVSRLFFTVVNTFVLINLNKQTEKFLIFIILNKYTKKCIETSNIKYEINFIIIEQKI